jgi:enoyl-CoA hydratase/carnithine racemase
VASFIGGADVQELYALSSTEEARTYITRVHKACAAIQSIPVPVIARVHGFSLGAGLEMMAACDLKIATKDSKFGMPEVKIGLPSVVEAALFPGLIGWGRTRRLVYLAENISAKMAEEWGLVERIVDDVAALDKAVDEWVDMIVSMGPKSIRNQKRLVTKWERSTLTEGIAAGIDSLVESYTDGGVEAKEYIRPFLGRKK